jgi:hypothetical protein
MLWQENFANLLILEQQIQNLEAYSQDTFQAQNRPRMQWLAG